MSEGVDRAQQSHPEGRDSVHPEPENAVAQAGQLRRTRGDRFLDLSVALVWAIVVAANLDAFLKGGSLLDASRLLFYTLLTFLFLRRRPATHKGMWWENILAWVGTILPMVGLSSAPGGWSILGLAVQNLAMLVMIVALLSLGRSFGIAPADRGLVRRGLYRCVRHPLYAAELWFIVGYLVANPSWRNLGTLLLLGGIQVIRALREERIISGYAHYVSEVRWRLLPLVW